jgi:hypothetical protein
MLRRQSMPTRAPVVWAVSLPVCVAGWLTAHSLAYRLLASGDEGTTALVDGSSHGYLAHSPHVLAASGTVLLLAVAGTILAGAAGRRRPAVPLAPIVVLPLLDFALHTMLASSEHGREVSAATALEPVFLAGVALQVPLALAALLLARAALAWAEGAGRGLPPRWRPRLRALVSPAGVRMLCGTEHRPAMSALASGYAQRGPPPPTRVR